MANTDPRPDSATPRPQEGEVRFVFDKFQAFVDEYRPRISLGGAFLESDRPRPVGSPIACEFRLADGFLLCRAVGEVEWILPPPEGSDRPVGMGVRFQELDDQGRELIAKIMEEQVKGGADPFDVDRVPAGAVRKRSPAAPRTGAAAARSRPSPPPGPGEDPASTHPRPAIAAGFNAPWGRELPGPPEDVIESTLDEEVLLATAHADFDSDLSEAGFASDTDLLEMEAPDFDAPDDSYGAPGELSFSDAVLDQLPPMPSFEPGLGRSLEPELEESAEPAMDHEFQPARRPPDTIAMAPVPAPPEAAQLLAELSSREPPAAAALASEPPSPSWTSTEHDEIVQDEEWNTEDAEAEWVKDSQESGFRSLIQGLQMTLAESKGRFLAIIVLLFVVAAGLVFKESLLGWAGLGSPAARQTATPPTSSSQASPEAAARSSRDHGQEVVAEETAAPAPTSADEPDQPELIEVDAAGAPPLAAEPSPPAPGPDPSAVTAGGRSERPATSVRGNSGDAFAPATRVERITFDQAAEGTRLTVWLDGHLAAGRFEHQPLAYDPLKEQIVISGIASPFKSTIEVGTLELDRIRTGHHDGSRLNLVFDLSSEQVMLAEIRSQDDRLEILVRRR